MGAAAAHYQSFLKSLSCTPWKGSKPVGDLPNPAEPRIWLARLRSCRDPRKQSSAIMAETNAEDVRDPVRLCSPGAIISADEPWKLILLQERKKK
jgi:hypothetical protein